MTTKTEIVNLLMTNDKAVARALLALTARQTSDEQASENTRYRNGRGFRPCHAHMGTSMAKFFQRNGYLSPKQIAYWRTRGKDGKSRIEIYAGQLLEVAQERAIRVATAAAVTEPLPVQSKTVAPAVKTSRVGDDVGNMLEERMVLQEQLSAAEYEYGMYQDSDDELKLTDMAAKIDQLKAQLTAIDAAVSAAYAA